MALFFFNRIFNFLDTFYRVHSVTYFNDPNNLYLGTYFYVAHSVIYILMIELVQTITYWLTYFTTKGADLNAL